MAIFYQDIKGLSSNNTYTYIHWGDYGEMPGLYQSNDNWHGKDITEQTKSHGQLVTTGFENKFTEINHFGTITVNKATNSDGVAIFDFNTTGNSLRIGGDKDVYIINPVLTNATTTDILLKGKLYTSDAGGTVIDSQSVTTKTVTTGVLNTPSDRRIKTDIKPVTNMTELVNAVPVYTYTMTTTNSPMVGVMAQDLLQTSMGDLLVNNPTADGQTSFMSIKENKLIYVLWQALQEANERISTLEEKLNK